LHLPRIGERKDIKTGGVAVVPKKKYSGKVSEILWGLFWIVCLFGLLFGVFGLGKDKYNETNKNDQQSVKLVGGIILVVLVLTAIFTIT
jgi:uncharacterized membrane protein